MLMDVYNKGFLDNKGNITYEKSTWTGDPPEFHIDYFYHYHWYPTNYPHIVYDKSSLERAYNICLVLLEKKVIKVKLVKDFVA